jgi:hypothetical protein
MIFMQPGICQAVSYREDHNYNMIHAEITAATAPAEIMAAMIKHTAANFR